MWGITYKSIRSIISSSKLARGITFPSSGPKITMFCYLDSEDCSPFFRISPLCSLPFSTKHCLYKTTWVLSPKRSYHIIFDYIPHCSIRININRQFFIFFKSLCHKVSISFQEKFLQNTVEESRRIWEEYQQYFDLEWVAVGVLPA